MSLGLYIFAGINGAGESTLYTSTTDQDIKTSKRANADEIARDNLWDWHNQSNNLKAMRIELKRICSFIDTKQSFNMETTFASSKNSYLRILKEAKKQGFTTHLLYIGVESSALAKTRVKSRVRKGGHGVPDEIIDRRYPKSFANLEYLISHFDIVDIFDNSYTYKHIYRRVNNHRNCQIFCVNRFFS